MLSSLLTLKKNVKNFVFINLFSKYIYITSIFYDIIILIILLTIKKAYIDL